MKNKVNPLAIGMFVLVAVAIAIVTVMVFGAAKFFSDTEEVVSLFSESVNGLDVGAPVKYKGVLIGKVSAIRISAENQSEQENSVAIVYSIDLDMLRRKTRGRIVNFYDWLESQVRDGLRAKLNYQSIVTGMLYIELDYLAEKDEDIELKYGGFRYVEVPSAKSGLAELGKAVEKAVMNISQIDFKDMASNANSALLKINAKLDELDVKDMSAKLTTTLANADELLKNSNALVSDPNIAKSLRDLDAFLVEGSNTLTDIRAAVGKFDGLISPQSPFRFELALLFRNLNESMSSISNFMEYLQRNPSSLLTGKANSERPRDSARRTGAREDASSFGTSQER